MQLGFVLGDDSADGRDVMLQLLDAVGLLLGGGGFGGFLFQSNADSLCGGQQFLRLLLIGSEFSHLLFEIGTERRGAIAMDGLLRLEFAELCLMLFRRAAQAIEFTLQFVGL